MTFVVIRVRARWLRLLKTTWCRVVAQRAKIVLKIYDSPRLICRRIRAMLSLHFAANGMRDERNERNERNERRNALSLRNAASIVTEFYRNPSKSDLYFPNNKFVIATFPRALHEDDPREFVNREERFCRNRAPFISRCYDARLSRREHVRTRLTV